MEKLKNILKTIIGKQTRRKMSHIKRIYTKYKTSNKKYSLLECIVKTKVIKGKNKKEQFQELLKKVEIGECKKENKFYYNIDIFTIPYTENDIIGNLTIDYRQILEKSLNNYKDEVIKNEKNEEFCKTKLALIETIEDFINRIIKELREQQCDEKIIKNLENIKSNKANNFEEALQRILFFNQLLWQAGHYLNGLGRLDLILEQYYVRDIENDILNKEEAKSLIKEFLEELHKDYYFKSNTLSGDTGQIIVIGGTSVDGEYQCNEITYMLIDIVKELQLPDPKLLLRVSSKTPRDLIEKAVDCIQTGIGCPLLANDDTIINKLVEFGYEKEESYNYVTSACWEPLIAGKALDQNNEASIVFMNPLQELLDKEPLEEIKSFDEFLEKYKTFLKKYLESIINKINNKKYEEAPLLSLFYEECLINNKDISEGGAKYNNNGFTGVGLANLVNSLINIKKFVFEEKEISICELRKITADNFENNEEWLRKLKSHKLKYGIDNEDIIELVNYIIKYTSSVILENKNQFGCKYKFGLSSPSYIDASKDFPASFDGRKKGEPFAVHISSDASNAYTELMQFASKLDYNENRFNGNVIDFFITPNFIKDNFNKFVDFIMLSIKLGFFEMQMNVISSKILIEARKNPEKFPNLIVRVWGFSSYFNDLPDEYKDYLIERALKSEGNSN